MWVFRGKFLESWEDERDFKESFACELNCLDLLYILQVQSMCQLKKVNELIAYSYGNNYLIYSTLFDIGIKIFTMFKNLEK